ncbi:CHASE2 domain-containing protein [Porticoccaceae bacterium]|nr:CHASE2 domain-containing protein [Porticoccaceae bacterium]
MKPQEIRELFRNICAQVAAYFWAVRQRLVLKLAHWAHENHLANQFKAAVFVASVGVLVNEAHLLDRLNNDFLRLSLSIASYLQTAAPDTSTAEIVVVLLDDLEYESRFKQESPLDRNIMSEMIGNLLGGAEPPKVLAIDFDLSSGLTPEAKKDFPTKSSAEQSLYCTLQQGFSGSTSDDTSGGTSVDIWDCPQPSVESDNVEASKIVLITPQPVFFPKLAASKVAWIEELCRRGIQFGLPDIMSSQGLVMVYQNGPLTLARQVAAAVDERGGDTICGDLKFQHALMQKFSILPEGKPYSSKQPLLNFDFGRHIHVTDYRDLCPTACSCDVSSLAGKIVFFGGHYGFSDLYDTPAGTLSGVQLHAASYYSMRNQVDKVSHLVGYLLEILLGIIIGISFYRLACTFRRRQSLKSLLTNFTLQPFLLLAVSLINGLLLRYYNISFDLAPVAFGMAMHITYVRLEPTKKNLPEDKNVFFGIADRSIKNALYWIILALAWSVLYRHIHH